MEDLSILWVAAVLIAIVGLEGCASPTRGDFSSLPPVPSASDTNRIPAGASTSSSSEVSTKQSDIPSANAIGTTGSAARR